MRLTKIIGGAAILLIGSTLEALNYWHLLDFILNKLRDSGPFGPTIANIVVSPIAVLVIVFTGLGIAVAGARESRKESGSPLPTIPTSVNVTNEPSLTPSMSQNIYVGTPQPLSSPVEVPDDNTTLEFVQFEGKRLARGSRYIWEESPDGLNGIVAVFRNEPKALGSRTPTASSVTAHLKFNHPTEQDAIELYINHGTWLGKYEHFSTFRPAETHSLIITVHENMQIFSLDNPNRADPLRNRFHAGASIRFIPPTQKEIPYRSGIVEITLVSGNLTVFRGRFSYDLEDSKAWKMNPINL